MLELLDPVSGLRMQEFRVHDELIQLLPDLCFCLFGAHGFRTVWRSEFLMGLWAEIGTDWGFALHPLALATVAVGGGACPPSQVAGTFQMSG